MDIKLSELNTKRFGETRDIIFEKVKGKSGRYWYIPTDDFVRASRVHVEAHPSELAEGYNGFKGYAGSTLSFKLCDGTIEKVKAPWHSNTSALFVDTGIDLSDQHYTIGVLSKNIERPKENPFNLIFKDVLYYDKEPVKGKFTRVENMAQEFANTLKHRVEYYSISEGGSSQFRRLPNLK